MTELKDINRLPVITWRWLKVNDLSLKSTDLSKIPEYEHEFIKNSNYENIVLTKDLSKGEVFNNIFEKDMDYGVSKELLELAQKHYNSGAFIHVPKEEKLVEPVRIDYKMNKHNAFLVDNNVIIAEENSEITIIMEYGTEDQVAAFHNGLTKIYAKDGAKVNLIKTQTMNDSSKHFDSVAGFISYGAQINYISVELGADISVTNYVNNLNEPTGKSSLRSIYLGDGSRTIDLSYRMNHRGMRTFSDIETRGVLKDYSKKVFRGTIDFKKGAVKAKGAEEEYVILLDSTVKSDAIPLLLCDEDDVEGQHAASAGKINEDKMFYLMSRGFSEKQAKKLIVEASFRPIIDAIPSEEVKNYLDKEIQKRIIEEKI